MDFATFDAMAPEEKTYERMVNMTALAAGVPPCSIAAICRRESNWDAQAHSKDGGFGICQITAGATDDGRFCTRTDEGDMLWYNLYDASDNLIVAAKYFLRPAIDDMLGFRKQDAAFMDAISPEILFFAFCCFNEGIRGTENHITQRKNPDYWTTNLYGSGTMSIYHRYLAMAHAGNH